MYENSYQLSDIDIFPEISWICLRNSLSMKFSALKTVSACVYPPKTRMQFKTANSQVKRFGQEEFVLATYPSPK